MRPRIRIIVPLTRLVNGDEAKALDYAEVFRKILNRHTHEQEDILTSAVLHAYT